MMSLVHRTKSWAALLLSLLILGPNGPARAGANKEIAAKKK